MVHFNFVQILIAVTAVFIVVGGPTYFCRQLARTRPSAVVLPGIKSGVDGLLLLLVACLIFMFVRALYETGMLLGEVIRVAAMNPDFILPALCALVPGLLTIGLTLWSVILLTIKRRARVLSLVIVNMWLVGPVFVVMVPTILGIPINTMALTSTIGFTVLWTLYLVFSQRVALTYGTHMAQQLKTRYEAMSARENETVVQK